MLAWQLVRGSTDSTFFEQAISEAEDQKEPSLKLVWVF
jgi:hypothetical protein